MRMGCEILCSAKTSRKRATARAPLGQLPDFKTTRVAFGADASGPVQEAVQTISTTANTTLFKKRITANP